MKINRNPQYFEGVLQLRNPTGEIMDFIVKEMDKKGNVWIAKTKKHKNGIDLFLSSNRFLAEIGKKLKDRFSGELVKSKTLHTQNSLTSKDVFRGCVLFRHYPIKKGEIIRFRGEDIEVLVVGDEVFGKNVKTKEKVHIKYDQLHA
jgi:NMD protein affecting ribosome stability and mRNA decay